MDVTHAVRYAAAGALALFVAIPVASGKKATKPSAPTGSVAALFLITKGKVSPRLHGAVSAELLKAPGRVLGLTILSGKQLKKASTKKPEQTITACGSNVLCIAKLGAAVHADNVVYGRLEPSGKGVRVQFLVVSVASQIIVAHLDLELIDEASVASAIEAKTSELFGPTWAAPTLSAVPSGGDELPLELVLGAAPATASGADETPLPALVPLAPGSETQSATTEVAAVMHDSGLRSSSADSGRSYILTYAGIGAAAVGAVGIGMGGYFGVQARSTRDSIEIGRSSRTQISAGEKLDDAKNSAGRANVMFGIGGGLVAVGAVLVTLDLLVLGDSTAHTSVTVGSEATGLVFDFNW